MAVLFIKPAGCHHIGLPGGFDLPDHANVGKPLLLFLAQLSPAVFRPLGKQPGIELRRFGFCYPQVAMRIGIGFCLRIVFFPQAFVNRGPLHANGF